MAVRSASDVVYVVLARLPLYLVAFGVLWVLLHGLLGLESYSFGTEFLIGNDETANVMPTVGQQQTAMLEEAIASGDVDQMTAALDRLEQQSGATAAPPIG